MTDVGAQRARLERARDELTADLEAIERVIAILSRPKGDGK